MTKAAAIAGDSSQRRREGYAVHIEGLRAVRGERAVLHDVLLAVPRGQVWALMGVSGAGKSTLLRTVAGLEPFDHGRIVVEQAVTLVPGPVPRERDLRALREHVGFVFQQHALFAHLCVLDNVTLAPRHVRGLSRRDAESRAMALLEELGVAHRAQAMPGEISGGEAQRVAIARALALDPGVLLMDEPTAALDPARRRTLAEGLRALTRDGRSLLITTHDTDFAEAVADNVAVLADGQVVEVGAPGEVLRRPRHRATRALLSAVESGPESSGPR
jgi:ABC-type polar amino acid transport system ATPase subunit